MKKIVYLVFMVLFLSVGIVNAQQTGETICYGWYSINPDNDRVVTSTVSNNDPVHEWTFKGEAGTFASIRMEATGGDLDPFVYVTDDTTGERIVSASANDLAGRRIASVQNIPLASDGQYTITATRIGEGLGRSAGEYKLGLEKGVSIAPTFGGLNHEVKQSARMFDGEAVRGTLPSTETLDAWYFTGEQAQQITAVLRGVDGTIMRSSSGRSDGEYLILFQHVGGTTWNWIQEEYSPAETGEIKIVNFELPETGLYALGVGTEVGINSYELTLAGAGGIRPELPPCGSTPVACPVSSPIGTEASPLANNTSTPGTVSNDAPIVPYEFIAEGGDVVSVTMERTAGDLETFIGLADLEGNILTRSEGFDPATVSINQFTLPESGCYYVYASRAGVSGGTTSGTFTITASGISGGSSLPQPPPDMAFGGDLTVGDSVDGATGDGDWRIAYRVRATDAAMSAWAVRQSGDLKPALVLLDANYEELDTVSANFAGDASNTLTFSGKEDDFYFIVVQREDGENGNSAGNFTLELTNP